MTEIPIYAFTEFTEFCSASSEGDTCQDCDWQASLKCNGLAAQDVQAPLIKDLDNDNSSVECLIQASRQRKKAVRAMNAMYAKQVDLLNNLRTYLSTLKSPGRVFEDSEVLAALEQISAFAASVLRECEIDGVRPHSYQRQILEGTKCRLQWLRVLSTHLGVIPPSALEETYDNVAKAWILKSSWSHNKTGYLKQSERAVISSAILSALANDASDDVLVTCLKAFLDENVPSCFVEGLFRKIFVDQMRLAGNGAPKDYEEALYLLAVHCRTQVNHDEMTSESKHDARNMMAKQYSNAVARARQLARSELAAI